MKKTEDNIKVKFRKESKRENMLKIAPVGSDDERIKRVMRQLLKRNETKLGKYRKSLCFSFTGQSQSCKVSSTYL